MTRPQRAFGCRQCGRREPRWLGHCPECGAWDSFVEERLAMPPAHSGRRSGSSGDGAGGTATGPVLLSEVDLNATQRFSSGIPELDLVLGGGIVPGSLVLVGGEPGIGKSTLLLQVLDRVAQSGLPVLLVCGEESPAQVKMRAERICTGSGDLRVLAETELESIIATIATARPALVVVDSIQTLSSVTSSSPPGSVTQVREAADRLLRLAKETGTSIFLVGHVTKEGGIAGPRVLEHVVDAVLYFEGDASRFFRIIRATKNRFGSTDELGVFEMSAGGLEAVADPSHAFLGGGPPSAGSAVHIAVEGSRCLLVQVEALVSRSELVTPRRVALGYDRSRLAMLVAVLSRHAGLGLSTSDVFVSIAGGIRIDEPAADLAVALAIASAQRDLPLPPRVAVFGEISLTGQLRSCSQGARRVAEAGRSGFDHVVMPASDARRPDGIGLGAEQLREVITDLLDQRIVRSTTGVTSDDGGD